MSLPTPARSPLASDHAFQMPETKELAVEEPDKANDKVEPSVKEDTSNAKEGAGDEKSGGVFPWMVV